MKMPNWPNMLGYRDVKLGLFRVEELLSRLGNPERKLPPIIHVAGTNGKGSTIAFMRSIMEAAGYKVHVYTSPHLINFNERIILAGKEISDDFLNEITEECRLAAGDLEITFFEGTTVAAFLAFSKVEADIVLLETGLGGRLDATNVIQNPAVTVITPISLDHMEYLGDTIKKIAGEKAAIVKDECLCISAAQTPEAMGVIEKVASEKKANLLRGQEEWQVGKAISGMLYSLGGEVMKLPSPSLIGDHQIYNAGAAIACVQNIAGFDISEENIASGIVSTKWRARLQLLDCGKYVDMLPSGYELWFDGGHNEAAAKAIAAKIVQWNEEDSKPLYMIIAMLKGREVKDFLTPLKEHVSMLYAVPIEGEENSQDTKIIVDSATKLGIPARESINVDDAISDIIKSSGGVGRIIICGSLYLAGTALAESTKIV